MKSGAFVAQQPVLLPTTAAAAKPLLLSLALTYWPT
jgi:hypothetical protein